MFLSYSHRDQALIDQLTAYLGALRLRGVIQTWTGREIEAGTGWKGAILSYIDSADIIVLALSADFLASHYSLEEAEAALKRHHAKQARVIPVLLRPVNLAESPFADLQVSPRNGRAITLWEDGDEAFLSVAKDIQRAAAELKAQAAVSDK